MGGHVYSFLSSWARDFRTAEKKSRQVRWRLFGMLLERTFQIDRNPSSASGFGKPKYQK
jgi:hypothetical protein